MKLYLNTQKATQYWLVIDMDADLCNSPQNWNNSNLYTAFLPLFLNPIKSISLRVTLKMRGYLFWF
jgi:hypothetical protein